MNHCLPAQLLLSSTLLLATAIGTRAQCTNPAPFPIESIVANGNGTVTTITGCNWQAEHATITAIIAGASYEFTMDTVAWVTVHQGSFDGVVLGYGPSPLTVQALTTEDLFVHWNVDSLCAMAQNCHMTTVQLLGGGCTPPEALTEVIPDCDNEQFTVHVEILNTGDASSVGLSWTVNGGAPNNLSGLQAGTFVLGPFAIQSVVDLTVVHAEQPSCNVAVNDLTNEPCATQSCGPDTYTFCYGNNENYLQTYQGTSTFPLQLHFNSGNVSGSGNDALVIHDGLLPTDPVLFSGVGNAGNLTGVTVVSTNPDHALTITFTSNGSFSCADGGVSPPWNYTVGCLDCVPPAGEAGTVTTDCDAQEFTVEVTVSDMGSASSVQISNSTGEPETTVTEPGTYTAGPFPVGTPVELSLVNIQSTICSVPLGTFENEFCPLMIDCGTPALEQSYCYLNSDSRSWLYENAGTESLAILFSSGSIESVQFDHLTIHDGDDDTAPILYDHTLMTTELLAGLLVISTGPALYMEMSSDPSISCADGGQSEWNWTVGCLDCVQPEASYEVVLDCENGQFSIATEITALGSDSSITITNTGGAPLIEVTETGTYNVGPFALGADVQVNLVGDNALCNVHSPVLTSAPCPLVGCGPFTFDYCYPDNMDTTIVYQSGVDFPISLLFNSGTIDLFDDFIEVYDGLDYQSPLVYTGTGNNGDLTGLQFTSTNPDNALCVHFVSNAFTSCAVGAGEAVWNWNVSCLDCTNPTATFELVEDCLHHGFDVVVDVTSLGSAADLRITDSWSQDTVSNVGLGTTTIGTIPVGQTTQITVLNGSNPLCRINSEEFTLSPNACVVTACEMIGVEYCYGNADTAWFVYQSGDNVPLSVSFAYGQLLDGDEIWIYNGLDETAQLVFAGDLGGDVTGLALSSSNPDNALMFQVISDGEGSCATGEATTPLYWTVGCGLVAAANASVSEPLVFPQPSEGMLNVRWPAADGSPVTLELYDLTGRCAMRETYRTTQGAAHVVNVEELSAGGYILRLTSSQGTFSGPVTIGR